MQSIIVVGSDKDKLRKACEEICKENKISKFDIDLQTFEKSVGIGDIRKIKENIFLKPISGDKKALIIESFTGFTLEAQNSFLKILEEPPLSTITIILASSLDIFLPTIISRCNIIAIDKVKKIDGEKLSEYVEILNNFSKNEISYSLKLAQDYGKSKEDALNFLEGMIFACHEKLKDEPEVFAKISKKLQKTYQTIKSTNVNVRFALENLFLNLF